MGRWPEQYPSGSFHLKAQVLEREGTGDRPPWDPRCLPLSTLHLRPCTSFRKVPNAMACVRHILACSGMASHGSRCADTPSHPVFIRGPPCFPLGFQVYPQASRAPRGAAAAEFRARARSPVASVAIVTPLRFCSARKGQRVRDPVRDPEQELLRALAGGRGGQLPSQLSAPTPGLTC